MRISPTTAIWWLLAIATCFATATASMMFGDIGAIIALLPAAVVIGQRRQAEELRGRSGAASGI